MTIPAVTLGPTADWYLTRSTGLVALLLLTAIMVLGVVGSMRLSGGVRWPRFAVAALHRDLSLLAIAFTAVHVITSVLDGYAPIQLLDGVIPFGSAYRPLWLGFGALAFDLMVALSVTSLVRRRLGFRAWQTVHWLAYASWPIAILHGLGSGSDSRQVWALALTFLCVLVVAVAAVARILKEEKLPVPWRNGSAVAVAVTPLALAVFTVLGPLAPHWALRAGTPARLVTGAVTSQRATP